MIMGRLFTTMGALGLAACASQPATQVAHAAATAAATAPAAALPLAGTRWIGVVEGTPDPRTLPRLEFINATRITGFTGCNLLSGAWHMEGAEVRVGPIAMTKRACAGAEGEVERRVVAAFGGRVAREGERLVFIAPTGERFEFTPAQAS
jgi:heat shock protein HslJ